MKKFKWTWNMQLALAAMVVILGCGVMAFGADNPATRDLGSLLCVTGVLFLMTRLPTADFGTSKDGQKLSPGPAPSRARGPGRVAWGMGAVSLLACGAGFAFLSRDALDGYGEVWPVYFFAACGVVTAMVWGYLAAKIVEKLMSKGY